MLIHETSRLCIRRKPTTWLADGDGRWPDKILVLEVEDVFFAQNAFDAALVSFSFTSVSYLPAGIY